MSKAVDLISNYSIGDRLRADDLQSLVDFAKRFSHVNGYNDQGETAQRYIPKSNSGIILHFKNTTGAVLPPYSVFNPSGTPSAFSDPPLGDMDKLGVTGPGSPFVYLTNDSLEIPDDANAEVRIIPFDQPTLLRVNTGAVPKVWEPCGVEFETHQLHKGRMGFVCLSEATEIEEIKYIWAARAREPIRVVGEAYGNITAYNVATKALGTGIIKVHYRDATDANKLKIAKEPKSKAVSLQLEVWNRGLLIADGTLISAVDALGIGLIVDYIAPALVTMTVVTDVRVDGLTLQKKTREIKVEVTGDESDWTTWHTGSNECPQ